MRKLLIAMLICMCVTTTGFTVVAWKFYHCPCCYHSRSPRTIYKPTGVIGTVKGNKIGVVKNNPNKGSISSGAIIIVDRTGKVIDIKRF